MTGHFAPSIPRPVRITRWPSVNKPRGQREAFGTWAHLYKALVETPLVIADPDARPGWSPALFKDDRRKLSRVESCAAVAIDYEWGTKPFWKAMGDEERRAHASAGTDLAAIADLWGDRFGFVHSTYFHRERGLRYRVVLPTTRLVTGDEYRALCSHFAALAKSWGHHVDTTALDPSRLWYVPSVRPGHEGEYERLELEGEPLDPDPILADLAADPLPSPVRAAPRRAPHPGGGTAPTASPVAPRAPEARGPSYPGEVSLARLSGLVEQAKREILATGFGLRNDTIARLAFSLGGLVHYGLLSEGQIERELIEATREAGWDDPERTEGTIRRQLAAGTRKPRTLDDRPFTPPSKRAALAAPIPPPVEEREPPTLPSAIEAEPPALPPDWEEEDDQEEADQEEDEAPDSGRGSITLSPEQAAWLEGREPARAAPASPPPPPPRGPVRPAASGPSPRRPAARIEDAAPGPKGSLTKTQKAVDILKHERFVKTPSGRLFLCHEGIAVSVESEEYFDLATKLYWSHHRNAPNEAAIKESTRMMRAHTEEIGEVSIRVAGSSECLAVDLGRGEPWVVTKEAIGPIGGGEPPLFARPSGSGELPRPVLPRSDEDSARVFARLREVLDVQDEIAWACCLAWLLACMRPVGPYPILIVRGEKGSGKSTLSGALRRLVDPRAPELKGLPRGQKALENLAIGAEHAHVVAFDNLSSLDAEISDALCRLATGDAFETRKLYRGRDLEVFTSCRPLLLNGISDAATRADLLDRALLVPHLPARTTRADDDQIAARVAELAPEVLGALLWCCSRAMQALAAGPVEVPGEIRMQAAARWATAAEASLGLPPGAVVAAYQDSREEAADVDSEDPVCEAILSWWAETLGPAETEWTGRSSELLRLVTRKAFGTDKPPGHWPESGRGMKARLDRLAGSLRARGLFLVKLPRSNGKRLLMLSTIDPSKAAPPP